MLIALLSSPSNFVKESNSTNTHTHSLSPMKKWNSGPFVPLTPFVLTSKLFSVIINLTARIIDRQKRKREAKLITRTAVALGQPHLVQFSPKRQSSPLQKYRATIHTRRL